MTAFRFRLDRLMAWREFEERQQARALHEASRIEDEQRRRLEASNAHLESVQNQVNQSGAIAAGMWRNYGLMTSAARERATVDEQARARAAAERTAEEAKFEAARAARRAIERLRELRHEEWRQHDARADQKDVDEVARRMTQNRGSTT